MFKTTDQAGKVQGSEIGRVGGSWVCGEGHLVELFGSEMTELAWWVGLVPFASRDFCRDDAGEEGPSRKLGIHWRMLPSRLAAV